MCYIAFAIISLFLCLISYLLGLSDSRHIDAVSRLEDMSEQLEYTLELCQTGSGAKGLNEKEVETEIHDVLSELNMTKFEANLLTDQIMDIIHVNSLNASTFD